MNLGSTKIGVLMAVFACLIVGGIWSGVSGAGPSTDTDGDGRADFQDNCSATSNTNQLDSSTSSGNDTDGIGNRCDADYDGNSVVGASDQTAFKLQFNKTLAGGAGYNPDMDSDDNDAIGASDLTFFKLGFNLAPGPSSCTPSGCI